MPDTPSPELREISKRNQAFVALDAVAECLEGHQYEQALDTLDGLREHVVAAREASQE